MSIKTYVISVPVLDSHIFHVEAATEEEALAKLRQANDEGNIGEMFQKTYDGDYQIDSAEVLETMVEE